MEEVAGRNSRGRVARDTARSKAGRSLPAFGNSTKFELNS